ncbi:MAG: heavy metal translocating P-type ATPase [Cyanobacteria bacterium J06634_6]
MSQLAPAPTNPKNNRSDPSVIGQTVVLDVEGMMCASCVNTVEKKLAQCEGVVEATVNLVTEVAAVTCTPEVNAQAIAHTLSQAGYPSKVRQQANDTGPAGLNAEMDWLARKEAEQTHQTRQLAIATTLLFFSTLGHLQHLSIANSPLIRPLTTLPVINDLWFHGTLATLTLVFPARQILIEGFQGIRRGSPNMNTLVSLGALSAFITSLAALVFPALGWACFFDEPVMLLSFILIGRTLEQRAQFRAASSLRSLIALQPAQARLTAPPHQQKDTPATSDRSSAPDDDVQIPVSQVQVGEWLRVLPGEKVPVDGVIATGKTTLDESMLTGESMPVVRSPGEAVAAGTLNQSGMITLQVSRTGTNTTLGQMIQLVETAQTRKAPIQGIADVISGYFTYGVLTCAALTFCFWYFVGAPLWPEVASAAMAPMHHSMGAGMHHAAIATANGQNQLLDQSLRVLVSLKLAIAVVVVACPCALGLATPTAILVGSGIGAQQGLLIRGGDILEAAHHLDTLVFDKTGTLTTGSPQVTDCLSLSPDISDMKLLQIAATVEGGTQHPLAIAIQTAASEQSLTPLPADNFYTKAGFGISATLNNSQQDSKRSNLVRVSIGNSTWMQQNECKIDSQTSETAEAFAKEGKTVVFVAQNQQLIGLIGISDRLRPEAADTIRQLQAMGLNVQILSGDRQAAATAIATQLNLSPAQVQADVSPEGKVTAIQKLQADGHRVGLVGDGINDAPALVQADVGIALNSGTEVAMETADIVLMGNSLGDAIAAIHLSRRTFNKIRQNLAWAFTYNLICIPLAAGAFLPAFGLSLSPGFAGGLMALSSVTVVLNSLLLRLESP